MGLSIRPSQRRRSYGYGRNHSLTLLNIPDVTTWQRGNRKSVLDLAWDSNSIHLCTKWELVQAEDTGSDHALIRLRIGKVNLEETYNPLESQYNFRKADWKKAIDAAREQRTRLREEWKRAQDNEDMDDMAKIIETIILAAIEEGVPKTRRSWRSKKWFDQAVKEKRKRMARSRRWCRVGERESEEAETRRAEWRLKRNDYFREIRKKKKECWYKFVGEAEGNDLWGVWRLVCKKRYAKTPTIEHENTTVVTFKEKEKIFIKQLFPKAPNDTDSVRTAPQYDELPKYTLTEEEVGAAIWKQGAYKTPGPDRICFIALKELWSEI
ncbi:uncharacterized protein LAJ45_08990 [Morchella importuna]|uniref:uncharacterized protein n=1 Tax=Morchella importuna TaxID=1174673 RepID=UPI001E8E9FE3|nr:uncharacterized protein LAJ45_08990 [Morchella importuna]KAH8146911.1 hypothetical protein LAJ45_08990 [Morchella importuna]